MQRMVTSGLAGEGVPSSRPQPVALPLPHRVQACCTCHSTCSHWQTATATAASGAQLSRMYFITDEVSPRISLEEFRSFCAFFFLLQRRQAELQQEEEGGREVGAGCTGVSAPILKLLFTAADVGMEGGAVHAGSCDVRGDGFLGREELRRLFMVLIRESGSLGWLHMKYRADIRFKHMLTDYCKSPLQWTTDAALHEFLTFESPPAVAAAPHYFTDSTRLAWDGLSLIMETKRAAGGMCTIELLARRWMDAAIAQLAAAAPVVVGDEDGVGEGDGRADAGDCEEAAGEYVAPASAPFAPSASLPPQPAAVGGFYVGPGFPLPLGVSAPVPHKVGQYNLRLQNTKAVSLSC